MQGEDEKEFILEIDNTAQVLDYENALVTPLFDQHENLKGVIHLINKQTDGPFTPFDLKEVHSLSTVVSEVLNLCDAIKASNKLTKALSQGLEGISNSVQDKEKEFKYEVHMPEIIYKMSECQKLVKHLSDSKREAVFKEGTLVTNIFKGMTKENNKLMKMNELN